MANDPSSAKSTESRQAPAWLPIAALSLLLIVVPTLIYLFVYRESRIEDAIVRNFRALDAAAERVVQVTENLSSVVNGSSFGVSVTMLDELTSRLTGKETRHLTLEESGCIDGSGGLYAYSWMQAPFEPSLEHESRLELRYQLASRFLLDSNSKHQGKTEKLWNELYCLIRKHREYSAAVETIAVGVGPLPGLPLRPSAWLASGCGGMRELGGLSRYECRRKLQEWLGPESSERCSKSTRSTEFESRHRVVVTDCRPLRERNRDLHDALRAWDAADGPEWRSADDVIRVIDLFGVQSTADLDGLLTNATGFLSRSFDSHLIADGAGRILFEDDALSDSAPEAGRRAATPAGERRAATPSFSNHVNISALLRRADSSSSSRADGASSDGAAASSSPPVAERSGYGRSFVEGVQIEKVGLRVFVQPFVMGGVSGGSGRNSAEDRTASNGTNQPVYYVIGVVDDREFESAAIRLRQSLVIDATLALLVVLTLAPLVWFWTSGDRWVLGPLGLAGVCASSVVGVVLFVVLACGMVTNRIDERVLDSAMERVADRIKRMFDLELHWEIRELHDGVSNLSSPDVSTTPGEKLNPLEEKFYCDKADRVLIDDDRENWFLMNRDGRQSRCLSDGRMTRTPKLDLKFRDYFTHPKEGALWGPEHGDDSPPDLTCWRRVAADDFFIPCIVPHALGTEHYVPEGKSLKSSLDDGKEKNEEIPYFLERIDSVVLGDVVTVLAISTCYAGEFTCAEEPVAASGGLLKSLDRAVPPSHVEFAVVDRRTGQTLFHSDDDLAMATNFVDDVGGDPALRALLRSGASDTIGLVRTGSPVRAHVTPLRNGMPWALIVYRGHEIEDRLAGVTTALTVFFTFLTLSLVTVLAGLLLLAARLRKRESLPSFPVGLGRVMAARVKWLPAIRKAVTGARWKALGAAVGLALLVLVLWWAPWRDSWYPYLATGSVAMVFLYFMSCVFQTDDGPADDEPAKGKAAEGEPAEGETTEGGKAEGKVAEGKTKYGSESRRVMVRRVLFLSLVIVFLAVLPAGVWFSHHRAELSAGLNRYLEDRTVEAMNAAQEDYRLHRFRESGDGVAGQGDRTLGPQRYMGGNVVPRSDERGMYEILLDMLRPVVGLSTLSNDLMTYRDLRATDDDVASLRDVFGETFGYEDPSTRRLFGSVFVQLAIWPVLALALIGFIVWSIHEMIVRRPRKDDENGTAPECTQEEFERFWSSMTYDQQPGLFYRQPELYDQQLELFALARGGVVNSRRPTARTTLSALMNRGIVKVDRTTGVAQLCRPEFGEFIRRDVDRRKFVAWQKQERGGLWRVIWPPMLIVVALGLAFLFFANPEIQSTLLAGLVSLLPFFLTRFRGGGVSVPVDGGE